MESTKLWFDSLTLLAPTAPVLMVATFADYSSSRDDVDKPMKELYELVNRHQSIVWNADGNAFAISNKEGSGISELRRTIETVARNQDHVSMKVSLRWIFCLDAILNEPEPFLPLATVRAYGKRYDVLSWTEVTEMLLFLHDFGMIVYFNTTDNLSEVVTTNPHWLVDEISKLIRDQTIHPFDYGAIDQAGLLHDLMVYLETAVVSRDLLHYFWNQKQVAFLIDFMRRLLLLGSWSFFQEPHYLVPSMITGMVLL